VLETPHVVVGAAIATKIANPFISLPLAFASHFLLEKVPHWNPHLNTEKKKYGRISRKSTSLIIFDSSLALILGIVIAFKKSGNLGQFIIIILACFFSVLPDLIEAPYFFLNWNQNSKLLKKWISFQKLLQTDTSPFWGILSQLATITVALGWIFR